MNLMTLCEMPDEEFGKPDFDLLGERILRFQYVRDGIWRTGGFRFNGIAAIQIREDWCIEDWQDKTFYTLVEVLDSPWKKSVMSLVDEDSIRNRREKHHYAILADGHSYEFIAESWELLPQKEGEQEIIRSL